MSEIKVKHDEAVNYQQSVASSPNYIYTKVFQQVGGQSVPLQATSTYDTIFDIPASKVQNLSKHYLSWTIALASGGTDGAGNSLFNKLRADKPPIRSLRLYTRSGQFLCDIPDLGTYWKITSAFSKTVDELQAKAGVSSTALVLPRAGGVLDYNILAKDIATHTANNSSAGKITLAGGVFDIDVNSTRKYNGSKMNILAGGTLATLQVNCRLCFGDIPFSVLNMNKDIYTTENLQLLVQWAPYDTWGFKSTAISSDAGAVSFSGGVVPNPPVVSNYALYMAVESNETIASAVIQKHNTQGLNFAVPYPRLDVYNLTTATSGAVIAKINRGHGQRLLRVFSAERHATNNLQTSDNFNNSSSAGGTNNTTTSYYTTLDSVRLQPEDLSFDLTNAVLFNAEKCRGTIMETGGEYMSECPAHIDDFSSCGSTAYAKERDYDVSGLDLSVERNYQKFIQVKSALNTDCCLAIITQKTLSISPAGIVCN